MCSFCASLWAWVQHTVKLARSGMCLTLQGILERLSAGEVVVGDGGYVMQLERRGYVKAGHWTPEAAVEHPEAGARTLCEVHLSRCCFFAPVTHTRLPFTLVCKMQANPKYVKSHIHSSKLWSKRFLVIFCIFCICLRNENVHKGVRLI